MKKYLHSTLIGIALYAIFALLVLTLGCSTENPLCTDNYCVEGEIYPRSELADDAVFSEVAIDDSVILATLVGIPVPVETTPVDDSLTLADIVADVAAGGITYTGKIVTITGTVEEVFDSGGMILVTDNENVTFFVSNNEHPELLDSYEGNQTYVFTLFIRGIEPPEEFYPEYSIWSVVPKDTEIINVNLTDVISKVASGDNSYVSKFLKFTATIENDASIFTTTDTVTLVTNNDDINFFVSNRTFPPAIMNKYQKGKSYQFTVFFRTINHSDVLGYSVYSDIVIE